MMYFWPCWVFTAARTTLSCGAGASRRGGFSCCGVWAPGRTDFAAWGSRALRHRRAQQLWRLGSALQHVGSSRIRMEAVCPGLGGGFFTTELPGKPRGTADGQNPRTPDGDEAMSVDTDSHRSTHHTRRCVVYHTPTCVIPTPQPRQQTHSGPPNVSLCPLCVCVRACVCVIKTPNHGLHLPC